MDKKYTVKDFVKKYNAAKSDQTKETLIKSVICIDYLPYERKITICEKIIDSTYYTKDKNNVKKLHFNSPAQYMLYCLNLVNEYTNIGIDFKNSLDEFNLLNKHGLLDLIISNIPKRESKEFDVVLDMVRNDVIQNEYETHAFISNQVNRFGELTGALLKPAIEQLSKSLETMDEKTIDKMINKLKGLNGIKNLTR